MLCNVVKCSPVVQGLYFVSQDTFEYKYLPTEASLLSIADSDSGDAASTPDGGAASTPIGDNPSSGRKKKVSNNNKFISIYSAISLKSSMRFT